MNQFIARHAGNHKNCGALPCPDGYAHSKGTCGDSLELFIYIADGKISTVTFLVHGCDYIHACASILTELVIGRELYEAYDLEDVHIEDALGGLPREQRHCANLSVRTLKAVIADYYSKRRAPRWYSS